jgi:Fe-S cluster biogenesis protein NfuA
MVIVAWIVAVLVVAVLFYQINSRLRRVQRSLDTVEDRLSSMASRTEERIDEIGQEIDSVKAMAASNPSLDTLSNAVAAGNPGGDMSMATTLKVLLEEEINPAVAAHGGHVQLIDVKDKVAYVQLGGGCQGCGMVDVTLRQGIETRMKEVAPDLQELVDVTDHRGGTNPYYQPGKG